MVKRGKKLEILWNIMKHTEADKVLTSYLVFVFIDAALIWLFEPTIHTYHAALWYCYAVISTAGFGDVVVTTLIPAILSVLLTIYSLLVIAIITGVIVNYYTQTIQLRDKETLVSFMDRLERLPEMSDDELRDLSEQVKAFRSTRKME